MAARSASTASRISRVTPRSLLGLRYLLLLPLLENAPEALAGPALQQLVYELDRARILVGSHLAPLSPSLALNAFNAGDSARWSTPRHLSRRGWSRTSSRLLFPVARCLHAVGAGGIDARL